MSRTSGGVAVYRPKPGTGQSIAYTGTAGTIANAVGPHTHLVVAWATSDAYLCFDGSAATTSDAPVPANQMAAYVVTPGTKVSAIQVSAGGTLYMYETE